MLTPPSTAYPTVSGSDSIAIPPDMLEPKLFVITGIQQATLTLRTPDDIVANWAFDGNGNRIQQQPRLYYFDQTAFHFDSVADQAYPTALIYFQQPATLSASNDTNFLTNFCAMLLRRAVMRAACEWSKEVASGQYDRTYWEQACEDEIQRIQEESDRAVHAMVVGPQFIPPGMGQPWGIMG
jgi:hypothetical protein